MDSGLNTPATAILPRKLLNFLAIGSVFFAVIGILAWLAAVLAIASARRARLEIEREPDLMIGEWLCSVGEALGWAGLVMWPVWYVLMAGLRL